MAVSLPSISMMQYSMSGPFRDSNDNIYVVGRLASGNGSLCMLKSTDGGASWAEQDTGNRPSDSASMSFIWAVKDGTVIHIVSSHAASDNINYSTFNMSDAPSNPDTYQISMELVDTSTTSNIYVSIGVRSDGDVIVLYRDDDEAIGPGRNRISYARREGGSWTAGIAVDDGGNVHYTWGNVTRGEADVMWLSYRYGNTTGNRVKSLSPTNVLESSPTDLGNIGQSTRGFYYDDDGVERITWLSVDGATLSAVERDDGGTPTSPETVTTDASSNTAIHGAVDADVKTIYAIWGASSDGDIWEDNNADSAGWGTDTEREDATSTDYLSGNIFEYGGNIYNSALWWNGSARMFESWQLRAAASGETINAALLALSDGALAASTAMGAVSISSTLLGTLLGAPATTPVMGAVTISAALSTYALAALAAATQTGAVSISAAVAALTETPLAAALDTPMTVSAAALGLVEGTLAATTSMGSATVSAALLSAVLTPLAAATLMGAASTAASLLSYTLSPYPASVSVATITSAAVLAYTLGELGVTPVMGEATTSAAPAAFSLGALAASTSMGATASAAALLNWALTPGGATLLMGEGVVPAALLNWALNTLTATVDTPGGAQIIAAALLAHSLSTEAVTLNMGAAATLSAVLGYNMTTPSATVSLAVIVQVLAAALGIAPLSASTLMGAATSSAAVLGLGIAPLGAGALMGGVTIPGAALGYTLGPLGAGTAMGATFVPAAPLALPFAGQPSITQAGAASVGASPLAYALTPGAALITEALSIIVGRTALTGDLEDTGMTGDLEDTGLVGDLENSAVSGST